MGRTAASQPPIRRVPPAGLESHLVFAVPTEGLLHGTGPSPLSRTSAPPRIGATLEVSTCLVEPMAVMRQTILLSMLGLPLATQACGITDTLVLDATSESSTGGSTSVFGGAGAGQAPVVRASPFCHFKWGRIWAEAAPTPPLPAYQDNLGMMIIWIGYETDDGVNAAIPRMLNAIGPGGIPELQNDVTPVLYAYFIPKKSKLGGCDPTSTSANVCTRGAQWIRANRDYLRSVYDNYAKAVAQTWGTTKPIVWLFEPGLNDYVRSSQESPLTLTELSIVASDLIGTIKARMPNALISHFASAEIADFEEYFGALDLTRVDLINVTGAATSEYFKEEFRQTYPKATYRNLHDITGLPIYVDTGFGASLVTNHGWLTAEPPVLNQRIADGVVAVQIEPPTDAMQGRIDTVDPQLTPLACAQ
jgi:hypothetical protein